MTVSTLGTDKLKVSLDAREIKRLFGSYERIDPNNPNTKFALNLLLKQAVPESDFKLNCQKINVEIVKNLSGGCDIYFVKSGLLLKRASLPDNAKIFYTIEFACCEHAIRAAKLLKQKAYDRKVESRLFRTTTKYRIIISSERDLLGELICINEFAEKIHSSYAEKAKTEEYGKEIIESDALNILSCL